jgi:hypothetical protein
MKSNHPTRHNPNIKELKDYLWWLNEVPYHKHRFFSMTWLIEDSANYAFQHNLIDYEINEKEVIKTKKSFDNCKGKLIEAFEKELNVKELERKAFLKRIKKNKVI